MSLPTENPGATGIATGASKIDPAGAAIEADHISKMPKRQRGGFWSGAFATVRVEGRRLRFFAPAEVPAFPAIALRDLAVCLTVPDHHRREVVRMVRIAFAPEIRWRRAGWGVVRTLPLWVGLVAIERLADEGVLDPSATRCLLEAFADAVRRWVGATSDAEGGAIVSRCLARMTVEAEAAASRIGAVGPGRGVR